MKDSKRKGQRKVEYKSSLSLAKGKKQENWKNGGQKK